MFFLVLLLLSGCQGSTSIAESASQNQIQNQFSVEQNPKPVSMVLFGDIMLDRYVRRYMDKKGLDYPFEKMDQKYLSGADLLIANLEGPIAKNKLKTSKTIAFRFMPDVVPLLKKYSFDVLSLANNHATDMGSAGYDDSRDLLTESEIKYFGDPRGINENSVAKIEVNGQRIAFFGLEEVVYKIKDDAAVGKIRELVSEGYQVIIYPHWGIEYKHEPNKRQIELAHKFIDAGALMVIGGHPHVVQSYETYKSRPIFYSLGNAIFDQYFSNDTQEGLSLRFVITPEDSAINLKIELNPIRIDHSQMRLMTEEERGKFLERFAGYGEHGEEEKAALKTGVINLTLRTI